jgi:hypothetical protein
MSIGTIQTLLDDHLKAGTTLPLQLENTSIPVTSAQYIRATLLPIEARQSTVGVNGRYSQSGLYQIDIFTTFGKGLNTSNAVADALIDHFRGQILGTTTKVVINSVWRDPGQRNEPHYLLPVLVRWNCIY